MNPDSGESEVHVKKTCCHVEVGVGVPRGLSDDEVGEVVAAHVDAGRPLVSESSVNVQDDVCERSLEMLPSSTTIVVYKVHAMSFIIEDGEPLTSIGTLERIQSLLREDRERAGADPGELTIEEDHKSTIDRGQLRVQSSHPVLYRHTFDEDLAASTLSIVFTPRNLVQRQTSSEGGVRSQRMVSKDIQDLAARNPRVRARAHHCAVNRHGRK